MVKSMDDEIIS